MTINISTIDFAEIFKARTGNNAVTIQMLVKILSKKTKTSYYSIRESHIIGVEHDSFIIKRKPWLDCDDQVDEDVKLIKSSIQEMLDLKILKIVIANRSLTGRTYTLGFRLNI